MMHKIEIDTEVWDFLKRHAEPFEDTPNTVLRRLLLPQKKQIDINKKSIDTNTSVRSYYYSVHQDTPSFPIGTPAALQQILEVVHAVVKLGYTRQKATNLVAKQRRITPQSVIDKYCRQLGKTALEFDHLLAHDLPGLKSILLKHFPKQGNFIENFFDVELKKTF